MPEWIIVLVSVCFGALIIVLYEYLKYQWKSSARYNELMSERQLSSCNRLTKMIFDLIESLSSTRYGIEALRWPKDRRVTQQVLTRDHIEHAQKLNQEINELSYFVATNEMILGVKVVKVWNKYFGALMHIKQTVSTSTQKDALAAKALEKIMIELSDQVSEAVRDQLKGANIEFIRTNDLIAIRQEGQSIAKKLLLEDEASH
jgi:hypothetical protein